MKTMMQPFRNREKGIPVRFNRFFRALSLIFYFSIIYNVGKVTAQCGQLLWQDEFNGPGIDASKWDLEVGGGGWGTGQLDYTTNRAENARIENGKLLLEIRKEDYQGHQYTSGRMRNTDERCRKRFVQYRAAVVSGPRKTEVNLSEFILKL